MKMTLEQAKAMGLISNSPAKDEFKLTSPKKHYRYEEEQTQKQYVAIFRDMQAKQLFNQVEGLDYIEGFWMPQFGEKNKDKTKQMIQGQRNKALGYKAGTPDGHIVWKLQGKNPRMAYFETKSSDGVLSDSQKELHAAFNAANIPVFVIRKHDDFMRALKVLGILPRCYHNMY